MPRSARFWRLRLRLARKICTPAACAPAVAVGVNANDSALLKNVSGKTKAELGSDYFAHWAKGKN